MSKTLTVFSLPTGCGQCTATYRSLDKANIAYLSEDARTDESKARFEGLGHMQAPVLMLHDETGALLDTFSGFRPDKIEELAKDPALQRSTDTDVKAA